MSAPHALTPIRFGTDGWRAGIAGDYTFANVERVTQAYADYLSQQRLSTQTQDQTIDQPPDSNSPLAIVGYDRRFLSEDFAGRAAEVLAGNNFNPLLFDADVPTPLVSWAVREHRAIGGVVITASHNPAHFNGFKIKAPWGGSATPETTAVVESLVDARPPRRGEIDRSNVAHKDALESSASSYRAQIESYVDLARLRQTNARIVIDPMHGTGGLWVESFLLGGQLQVETIRAGRD
ncbi:MAG: hypothetical protein M3430_06810, partial [Acidobacteriota bacterium]|nr:hypothetical protein [Acidobacteriota bacterium]